MTSKPNTNKIESPTAAAPESEVPASPQPGGYEPGESPPQSRTWQEYARQFLIFFQNWFLKLKVAYRIILILFVAALLVLVVLAYFGILGQQVADLIKQLVTKLMELAGSQKTGS